MIHDTAQGQTQYDLCEELRAQVAALTEERDKFFADKSENAGLPSHVYQQVADLEAQVAALTEERDEKVLLNNQLADFLGEAEEKLAASQAREANLREIVAKMRADLKAIGGFENRFSGQPAVNIREYIFDLEGALDPIDDTALQQRLAKEREKCTQQCDDEASIEGIAQRCATKIRSLK